MRPDDGRLAPCLPSASIPSDDALRGRGRRARQEFDRVSGQDIQYVMSAEVRILKAVRLKLDREATAAQWWNDPFIKGFMGDAHGKAYDHSMTAQAAKTTATALHRVISSPEESAPQP